MKYEPSRVGEVVYEFRCTILLWLILINQLVNWTRRNDSNFLDVIISQILRLGNKLKRTPALAKK